jgi:acetylornithine/N-succinyldiaminopimelate aminotransferase
VFFCNSGAESVECALKAAKTHGRSLGKTEIIAFKKSFHGRTTGALALTGQNAYQKPFRPLLPHIRHIDFNDCDAIKSLITDKTAAVIVEPVQGEGGVNVASKKFLKNLRQWTRKQGALLILDEVQTGFGRTAKWFAYQHYGIQPDILCMAKAIAGGCPMGAVLIGDRYTGLLPAGTHASTFGGNYLACSAALAVLEAFDKEKVFDRMVPLQEILTSFFQDLKKQFPQIVDFRHLGMMYGLEFSGDLAARVAHLALERGLIINCTAGNVLRIMPALNLSLKDCRQGLKILKECVTDGCK